MYNRIYRYMYMNVSSIHIYIYIAYTQIWGVIGIMYVRAN